MRVVARHLHIRSTPSYRGKIVGYLHRDHVVKVEAISPGHGWVKIADGKWVSMPWLK